MKNFVNEINIEQTRSIEGYLQSSFLEELNIYNQAHLILDCPLIKTSKVRSQTSFERAVQFNIIGEIQGQVICFLDTYDKKINSAESKYLTSLFEESMNILLGKVVTNLENSHNLSTLLSSPIKKDSYQLEASNFENNTFSLKYKLITNAQEYDCRLVINVLKKNIIEV